MAEPAFDYVAVLVIGGVEDDRPAASRAATFAVPLLVSGFRDDGLDAALAQLRPGRAGRVRFVSADRIRSRPRSPDLPSDAQLLRKRQQHRRIPGLAGSDQRDQRQPVAVDELMDLGRQPTPRAADPVIRRLDRWIRVVRPIPLWGGSCSSHADARE
ncbi:hypothetical protein M0639_28595 [Rhodococcus qingshengii JCM 15477]|uniref:Uncharacterized protein n=1 Tax=Rhodococcus qingshengii JCM 15477 TaxID=1303681 RepID=A0AB38RCS9_RHOSG|nr:MULTISPECIES: hypothetical protein [Rhodococcus]UPU42942.1 hypothetical protein M0639_28595 [Rhodococcus qingshengii JCM 15477]